MADAVCPLEPSSLVDLAAVGPTPCPGVLSASGPRNCLVYKSN